MPGGRADGGGRRLPTLRRHLWAAGCDPKKVLVGAAEIIDRRRRMQGRGVAGDLRIDWPDLIRFKATFTDPFPEQREDGFVHAGVETFHGRARFLDQRSIKVGGDVLDGDHLVIAVGAWPARLDIQGEDHLTRSDQFLDLQELPRRIAFVGGGYIAFEFGHIAARAGSAVTHPAPRLSAARALRPGPGGRATGAHPRPGHRRADRHAGRGH